MVRAVPLPCVCPCVVHFLVHLHTFAKCATMCVCLVQGVCVCSECVRWLTFGWEFYEFTYFDYGHKLGRLAAVLFVSHTHSYLYMTFGKSHAVYGTDDGLVCCVYCQLVAVFVSRIIVVATALWPHKPKSTHCAKTANLCRTPSPRECISLSCVRPM